MQGYPIVYQDVMRVVVAGPLGTPSVGINRSGQGDVPLVLSLSEARELARALTWALSEYDARMGRESFYPHRTKREAGSAGPREE